MQRFFGYVDTSDVISLSPRRLYVSRDSRHGVYIAYYIKYEGDKSFTYLDRASFTREKILSLIRHILTSLQQTHSSYNRVISNESNVFIGVERWTYERVVFLGLYTDSFDYDGSYTGELYSGAVCLDAKQSMNFIALLLSAIQRNWWRTECQH